MLSERALHILNILEEQNGQPITAKKLAAIIGISERSIKTYINEVSDFCEQIDSTLIRKPGVGFVFCACQEAKEKMKIERDLHSELDSSQFRTSYIVYILLTGWSSYTMALFADELGVSKNNISEDLDDIEPSLTAFGLHLNRIAGKGISLEGDEFTKRKAFRRFCQIGIEQYAVETTSDSRLSIKEEKTYIANYGKKNFEMAVSVIQKAEKEKALSYTDYSFKMIVEYLAIQIMRIRQNKYLSDKLIDTQVENRYTDYGFAEIVERLLQEEYDLNLPEEEKEYIFLIFMAGDFQNCVLPEKTECNGWEENAINDICQELAYYVEDVLSADLSETELLRNNLRRFLPPSFVRTKYGLEVRNPFLQEVRRIYRGIFAVSFALARYYKKYVDGVPNEQELSFLALFIGGALTRSKKHMLKLLFTNELMIYIEEKCTKKEIIKLICHRMNEKKYVADTYLEDVLRREAICSTSLGKGIAIPHGSDKTVRKPGISVVRLKHGIEWGDGVVDTIFMLALNFDQIELTRNFFSEFTELIENDRTMERLRQCQSVDEMQTELKIILHDSSCNI